MPPPAHQTPDPLRTTWHITWGTYGTRLHGGAKATVDRQHNEFGEPFLGPDEPRYAAMEESLKFSPVRLTREQQEFAESQLTSISSRGGWTYRVCAAARDHVHFLCDVQPEIHGEKVRRLVKRWLGELLSVEWPLAPGATWWAEEGSNKAIHNEAYLNNAYKYILRQRASAPA